MPGIGELLIILVIVLIIFGAGKLPQIGDALGRGIRNFKKATKDDEEIEVTPKKKGEVEAGSKKESDSQLKEAEREKEPAVEVKEKKKEEV